MSSQPKHILKYCPVCGSKDFRGGDANFLHCSQCDFRWYFNSGAAVAALIENNDGHLLLTIRSAEPVRGTFDLPGGFVDAMESAEGAVRREVLEELGLELTHLSYFGSFPGEYEYRGLTYLNLDLAFICSADISGPLRASDDVSGYTFVALPDIDLDKIGLKSVREIIRKYIAHRS